VRAAALLSVAALVAACSGPAPTDTVPPSAVPASGTPVPTAQPSAPPSPSPVVSVRATSGVATAATVRGTIYLGFEACVGLTPDASSAYLPPAGQDDFVLILPKGWKVVAAHPVHPRFGDHFKVLDRKGRVVARDADVLEVTGEIRANEATYCGFGWPITVRQAHRVEG
jgi:hypothetical protein